MKQELKATDEETPERKRTNPEYEKSGTRTETWQCDNAGKETELKLIEKDRKVNKVDQGIGGEANFNDNRNKIEQIRNNVLIINCEVGSIITF